MWCSGFRFARLTSHFFQKRNSYVGGGDGGPDGGGSSCNGDGGGEGRGGDDGGGCRGDSGGEMWQ